MKINRKAFITSVGALATLALTLALAAPALATHYWYINGVSCDAATNTITITGYNYSTTSSTGADVYVGGNYLTFVNGPYGQVGGNTFSYTNPAFVAWATVTAYNPSTGTGATTICAGDDRINPVDAAGPVALFCDGDTLNAWDINAGTGEGVLAFSFSAWPSAAPAVNTKLAEKGRTSLWQLTSGEFQVNSFPGEGKSYAFVFNGCPYDGGGYNANIDPNE